MSAGSRACAACIVVALACGPTVDAPEGGTTGAASTSSGTNAAGPDAGTTAVDDGIEDGSGSPLGTSAAATDHGFGTAYEDDGGSDDGCTFTCPTPPGPPSGGGAVSFECDLERQDCPEGEKCMPWANDGGAWWNATRCSPLHPSPAEPGEPCEVEGSFRSGIDDCALGSMCQTDDFDVSDGEGTCVALCHGTCPDPGDACLQLFAGIPLCTHACDPLDPIACPEGRVCGSLESLDAGSGFVCLPISEQVLPAASSCLYEHECAPGLHCAPVADVEGCPAFSNGCCVPVCDLQDPLAACPAASGNVCTAVGAPAGSMWDELGLCVPPP